MRCRGHQGIIAEKKEDRPRVLCMAITHHREEVLGKPDVVLDIKEVADIKMNALKAHKSQTGGLLKEIEKNSPMASRLLRHGLKRSILDLSME